MASRLAGVWLVQLAVADEDTLATALATLVAVGEKKEPPRAGRLVPEQTAAQPHETDSNDRYLP
jgi:hypothetical protein